MIAIRTKLDSGISGGGVVDTVETYNVGPLNLRRAIRELSERRISNYRSYGSIGCGVSWIEINGIELTDSDLFEPDDAVINLQSCRELIKECTQ